MRSIGDLLDMFGRLGIEYKYEQRYRDAGAYLIVYNAPIFPCEYRFTCNTGEEIVASYEQAVQAARTRKAEKKAEKEKRPFNFNGDPLDPPVGEPWIVPPGDIYHLRKTGPKPKFDMTCNFDSEYASRFKVPDDVRKELDTLTSRTWTSQINFTEDDLVKLKGVAPAKEPREVFIDHSDPSKPWADYKIAGFRHRYNVGEEPESITGKTARALGNKVEPVRPVATSEEVSPPALPVSSEGCGGENSVPSDWVLMPLLLVFFIMALGLIAGALYGLRLLIGQAF